MASDDRSQPLGAPKEVLSAEHSLGIAPNILASRLERFVVDGVMAIDGANGSEPRRYRLTDKGRDLASALMALTAWGDRWVAPNGAPVRYEHVGCGGIVVHYWTARCVASHAELAA